MAISDINVITHGYHGKIGNVVIRRWAGKSVISSLPSTCFRKWSKAQKENRRHFRDAMLWARETLQDPVRHDHYRKKAKRGQTAWNAAVSDYLKGLRIDHADLSNYRGRIGDEIRITPRDWRRVQAVIVTIFSVQGFLLETGPAIHLQGQNGWIYKATEQNPAYKKSKVVIRLSDSVINLPQAYLMKRLT